MKNLKNLIGMINISHFVLAFCLLSLTSNAQAQDLFYYNSFGEDIFRNEKQSLTKEEVYQLFSENDEAKKYFKKGLTNETLSYVIGLPSSIYILYNVMNIPNKAFKADWKLIALSTVGISFAVHLEKKSVDNFQKATNLFNGKEDTHKTFPYHSIIMEAEQA